MRPALFTTDSLLKETLYRAFRSYFRFRKGHFEPREEGGLEAGAIPALAFSPPELKKIQQEIQELQQSFTEERAERNPRYLQTHALWGGYQFYYLARNLTRIRYLLTSLNGPASWQKTTQHSLSQPNAEGVYRILDVGCGSGTFSLAILQWLMPLVKAHPEQYRKIEVVLVDQTHPILSFAKYNILQYAAALQGPVEVQVKMHHEGVHRYIHEVAGKAGTFQMIGLALVLNELHQKSARHASAYPPWLAQGIERLWAEAGALVVLEPGTRQGYWHMLNVRDRYLEEEAPIATNLLYPCPHLQACPLKSQRGEAWCHATLKLAEDFYFDPILRTGPLARMHMRDLNLSGIVLQRLNNIPEPALKTGSRVLSDPLPSRRPRPGMPPANRQDKVWLTCTSAGTLAEVPVKDSPFELHRGAWWEASTPPPKRR